MDVRAAVAFAAGKPLTIETVQQGPKSGRCWSRSRQPGSADAYTLGADPEGLFPRFWDTGCRHCRRGEPGVTSLKQGDRVIPLYTPECRQCNTA